MIMYIQVLAGFVILAVNFARLTFPYLLFVSLAAMLGGILNTLERFVAAAAAPILLNVILIGALAGVALFDDGRAEDVGGHHVRRELHAREIELQRLRHRAHQQGLAKPRHPLEQRVGGALPPLVSSPPESRRDARSLSARSRRPSDPAREVTGGRIRGGVRSDSGRTRSALEGGASRISAGVSRAGRRPRER